MAIPTSESVAHPQPRWYATLSVKELDSAGLKVWKSGPTQLVLGRTAEGTLFALDNRCPHEGYPLAQGEIDGCLLTCMWHNWKFDVSDGKCVLGGEVLHNM